MSIADRTGPPNLSDDEVDRLINTFVRNHTVRIVKSLLVGGMALLFVLMVNGSMFKAFPVGVAFAVLCLFNAFQRFLAPLALLLFLVAVAIWIDIDFVALLKRAREIID